MKRALRETVATCRRRERRQKSYKSGAAGVGCWHQAADVRKERARGSISPATRRQHQPRVRELEAPQGQVHASARTKKEEKSPDAGENTGREGCARGERPRVLIKGGIAFSVPPRAGARPVYPRAMAFPKFARARACEGGEGGEGGEGQCRSCRCGPRGLIIPSLAGIYREGLMRGRTYARFECGPGRSRCGACE